MRIERVVARAFGPFRDQTLALAPGMTVVAGPNEAGKSTWHSAIRLALTGLRRSKGAGTAADRQLVERHRPWDDPERWEVEARLALDDGRVIDITQDLVGKVGCRAVEVGIGRDVSAEIMNGTPDASKWLGLDREAFVATVCVGQAQVMAVASDESAGLLQEHMQRAAATRGTDATAAEALERLADVRRRAVGADISTARGPLRGAKGRVAAAAGALAEAQRQHEAYLAHGESLEVAERRVAAARRQVAEADAALARLAADEAGARARRAAQLAARYPTRPHLARRDERADQVAAAIDAWERRPRPVELRGPSSAELGAELAALPAAPEGDRRPHPSVVSSLRAFELAEEAFAQVAAAPDWQGEPPGAPAGASATETAGKRATGLPAIGAVLAGIAALVALVLDAALLTAALVLAAGALAIAAWRAAGAGGTAAAASAHAASAAERHAERLAEWKMRREAEDERLHRARKDLADAIDARGAPVGGDVRAAWQRYEGACEERARQADAAGRATSLAQALEARRILERSAADASRAILAAEVGLREAARETGEPADAAPGDLVRSLLAWQGRQTESSRAAETAVAEWQELTSLLGDGNLADLTAEATRRQERAIGLEAGIGGVSQATAAAVHAMPDLGSLRDALEREQRVADSLAGELGLMQRGLPSVAEAEEELVSAREELEAIERLAGTLDETMRLLRAAQERVHRDLAPVLAAAVSRWLGVVSRGAYLEATVDPADLSVRVKEAATGQWRAAHLLSEGTREQVYLLLRLAMAEHLTTGETAPLLLDEATSQSDADRKVELLGVLHSLSQERQVVLFSHDDDVVAWAERTLSGPRDSLVRLPVAAGRGRHALEIGQEAEGPVAMLTAPASS